jgi:hypothetical protein
MLGIINFEIYCRTKVKVNRFLCVLKKYEELWHYIEVSGHLHAPTASFPRRKEPTVYIGCEAG